MEWVVIVRKRLKFVVGCFSGSKQLPVFTQKTTKLELLIISI